MDVLNNIFGSIFRYDLSELPFLIISLVIAFTFHEYAHAFVANKFGDPTAKNQGRLTLNPTAHLDPLGTLMILIMGFGWARPVPVNRYYFKNPKLAGVLVSLAGPASNFLIAFIGLFLWEAGINFGLIQMLPDAGITFTRNFFEILIHLNVLLFVFNLLPLPPLDGYRIIEDLVPANVRANMTRFEQYGGLIFLILVFVPALYQVTIGPIFTIFMPMVYNVFYVIIDFIF